MSEHDESSFKARLRITIRNLRVSLMRTPLSDVTFLLKDINKICKLLCLFILDGKSKQGKLLKHVCFKL